MVRESDEEFAPLAWRGIKPYTAVMPLDNSLTDGQAKTISGIGIGVDSLEEFEDSLVVRRPDAQAVVTHGINDGSVVRTG